MIASLRLARQRLLGAEELLGDLLRDRRAALREVAGGDVRPQRAGDALEVDAAVVEEVVILDREERVDELLRDLARTARTRATPSRTRRAACRRRRRCATTPDVRRTRRGRAACPGRRRRVRPRSSCRGRRPTSTTPRSADERREAVQLADPVDDAAVGAVRDRRRGRSRRDRRRNDGHSAVDSSHASRPKAALAARLRLRCA